MTKKIIKRSSSSSSAAKPGPRKSAGAGTAASSTKKTTSRRGGKPKDGDITEDELLKLTPHGMAQAFVKARLHDKTLEVAGLAPPEDWDGEMPVVPDDISATDHDELSNLLAQLVNAQSTALWYATKAHIEAGFFEDIEEYLYNVASVSAEGSNEMQRKANAKLDEGVVAAHALWRTANSDYITFRDLASTLDKKWKTVSRVGGFVGDDGEGQSAGLSGRSSRGKSAGSDKGSSAGGAKKTIARRRK